ncbi:MAG: LamG domain-containing protein, partial [Verrucomicrobiota bacterium]|nr:LamG domain-containing protein [Verrucomicrobiota bacterium]
QASDHFPVVAEVTLTNFSSGNVSFSFDESGGSNVVDSINGLVGTLGVNGPTWSNDTPSTQAGDNSLFFDGTKRITVPDPAQKIGTNGVNGDYTLQAWVKLSLDFVSGARMILFQYERTPGFSFSINTNRTLHTTTFNVSDISSTAAFPNDGQWHQIAVVHTAGVNMKFFVDATLAATVNYTSGIGFRTSSTLTIGSSAGGANPFTGFLDRISFDNQALTAAQLDFPAAISLGLRQLGSSLVLFWPASKSDYVLQTSGDLFSSSWSNILSTVQGNENQAFVSPSNATQFFRLKK